LSAGVGTVNGFYRKDGEFEGSSRYIKKCTWKGESRTLCIYKWGEWNIAIVGKNGDIGCVGNDIYSDSLWPHQDIVSATGWEPEVLGCEPGPVCRES